MLLSENSPTKVKSHQIVSIADFASLRPRPGWQDRSRSFQSQ
ncbi:MAG: hypothetical protein QNJ38_22545 [Prochloraceae cyanobacterium]|nr:hypothetical protein [Prochloraceae cyanobacterium]